MSIVPSSVAPVSVRAITGYLQMHGWRMTERVGEKFEIWSRAYDGSESELLVPASARGSDFKRRFDDLIRELSRYEGESPELIVDDLKRVFQDRVLFRVDGPVLVNYALPLEDVTTLYSSVKGVVVASACSALRRKGYHGRSRPKVAKEMARRVNAAIPRQGSYIVPLVTDIPEYEPQTTDMLGLEITAQAEKTLFPRRVLGTMNAALHSLSDILAEGGRVGDSVVNSAVLDGLSAESCNAIARILEAPSVTSVDVSFEWASINRSSLSTVRFEAGQAVDIRTIEARLKNQDTVSDEVIYGTVYSLTRGAGDDEGNVAVTALVDDAVRQVRMTLNDEQYHVASRANDDRVRVVVAGELHRPASGMYRMTKVDAIQIDSTSANWVGR